MRQRSLRVKLFIVCCDCVSVCARVLSIARLTAAGLFRTAFAEITNNSTGRMRLKSGKALRGAVSPQHEEEVPGSGMQRRKGGESGQKKSPCRLASAGTQESGVGNGTRTHDNRNHNPGLYQLSYSHQSFLVSQEHVVLERLELYRKFRVLQGVRIENTINTVYGVARDCGTLNFVVL